MDPRQSEQSLIDIALAHEARCREEGAIAERKRIATVFRERSEQWPHSKRLPNNALVDLAMQLEQGKL